MNAASREIVIEGPRAEITAEALSEIGAATFVETFGHLYSPENLQAFLASDHSVDVCNKILSDPAYGVWTALIDGKLAGYLVAGPSGLPVDGDPPNAGELKRLYVYKEWQNAGIGVRMLRPALAWLDVHFDRVFLSVYAHNHGAQRLYGRYGFMKIQDYFFMVGDHADPEFIFERVNGAATN